MSEDRNEGECYGPFHAGFVCEDCARRIHELETELADRDRRLAQLRTAWDGENEMRRKAETELREHRCINDKGEYT